MKIKNLIELLKQFDQEAQVFIGSDEELNNVFEDVQVATMNSNELKVVVWGNSGSEVDEI